MGRNAGAYDPPVDGTVILHAGALPSAPARVLRPWRTDDVVALVEVFRDPVLRHRTSSVVENEADATRWARGRERGRPVGDRFAFAVLEAQSDAADGQVVGHVVLKEAPACRPSAAVGCRTAAHARGRGVAAARSGGCFRPGLRRPGSRRAGASEAAAPGGQPGLVPRGAQERIRTRQLPARGAALASPRGSFAHTVQW
ncbi:GNAT family N-acetyltransferase [Streptomyces sp. NPDC101149]|uniref:GNAT family N-acetyltransferase n=1 Tax=Streptomyces sp. NPDC101149 TaxID=3366113 RepID=UPI003807692C